MKTVLCLGDCLTKGIDVLEEENYPHALQRILGKNYYVEKVARSMLGLHTLSNYPDLFLKKFSEDKDILCLWLGTNDLLLKKGVESTFLLLSELIDRYQEKFKYILLLTILPRIPNVELSAMALEESRKKFNSMLYKVFPNTVVNLNKRKGLRDIENLTYYKEDKTHLTAEGYSVVAKAVANKIKLLYKAEQEDENNGT